LNRIKQGIIGNSIWRLRQRQKVTADNNKIKGKELSSLQLFVVIASIIIILIALGGLGLVFNVFAQAT
jgi:ribosome biogenesis SPOUT family RNA methylase Rps3